MSLLALLVSSRSPPWALLKDGLLVAAFSNPAVECFLESMFGRG